MVDPLECELSFMASTSAWNIKMGDIGLGGEDAFTLDFCCIIQ